MLSVPSSLGEALDRITILELKVARSGHPGHKTQLDALRLAVSKGLADLGVQVPAERVEALREVNADLWEMEDLVRAASTDAEFLEAARAIPRLNDRRAAIKRGIDESLGFDSDQKVYT